MSYRIYLGSAKCSSIRCSLCHFPSNNHLLPQQKASSRLPSTISGFYGLEYQKRHNVAIPLSRNRLETRGLALSLCLADVAATATAAAKVNKPADVSVLVQTSALLLFMYFVTNFVVPQIITGKFDEERKKNNWSRLEANESPGARREDTKRPNSKPT